MGTWWDGLLVVLWAFMVLEGLLLFGILRQFGVLYRRLDELRSTNTSPFATQGVAPGTPAPAFTLPRLGGDDLSLSDYQGRPVLLAFLSPGCGPCEKLLPHIDALVDRPDLSPLQVLLVSQGSREVNRHYVDQHNIRSPLLLQEGREVLEAYLVQGTPFVFGIDANGVVRQRGVANGREQLESLLPPMGSPTRDHQLAGAGLPAEPQKRKGILGRAVHRTVIALERR
jgi:methylamine dehydrogenase accessory protein MauD